jgi:hypothetical protein
LAGARPKNPSQRRTALVFLFFVGLAALGIAWLELARARRLYVEDLGRVLHPSTDPRVVHDVGRAEPASGARFGVCHVEFKDTSRKAKYKPLRDVHDGTIVVLADGRRLALAGTTPIDFSPWQGDALPREPSSDELKRLLSVLPERDAKGTFRAACLSPAHDVFVAGCVEADSLVPCSSRETVMLAPGGRPAARTWLTVHAAGSIGFACMLLMLPLLCAWFFAAHLRAVTRTLGAHARGRPTRKSSLATVAFVVSLGAIVALIVRVTPLWDNTVGPVVGLALTLSLCAVVVFRLVTRVFQVSAALRVVTHTETTALESRSPEKLRELSVRVSSDAPTRQAPDGRPVSLVRVEIDDKTPPLDLPRRIPVEDASGRGVLDLERAVLDVLPGGGDVRTIRSIRELLTTLGATQAEADDLIGYRPETYQQKGKTRSHSYACKWWSIAPGAPLLVYGDVQRVPPGEAQETGTAEPGYREVPTMPLVHAGTHGMIVYVGEEAELARKLRRERTFTWIASPVFVSIVVACTALAGYVLR